MAGVGDCGESKADELRVRSVLESAQYIASRSVNVVIDKNGIDAAAEKVRHRTVQPGGVVLLERRGLCHAYY